MTTKEALIDALTKEWAKRNAQIAKNGLPGEKLIVFIKRLEALEKSFGIA